MKSLLKLTLSVLALTFTILLAGLAYLQLADLNRHTGQIETLVERATGRALSIGGNLQASVWPDLSLQVQDLALANADWARSAEMAQVEHLQISVAPLSLFFGPVIIRDFQLRNTLIVLEQSPTGESNWTLNASDTATQQDKSRPIGNTLPALLQNADVSSLVIQHVSDEKKLELLGLESLRVTPQENSSGIELNGTLHNLPLTFKATVPHNRAPLAIDFTGNLGELYLQGLINNAGEQLELDTTLTGLSKLGEQLALGDLPHGDVRVKAGAALGVDISLSSLSVAADNATLTLEGPVSLDASSHSMQVAGEGESLDAFYPGLPPLPFQFEGKVHLRPNEVEVEALAVNIDTSDILLDATLQRGRPLTLSARLAAQQFDTRAFSSLFSNTRAEDATAGSQGTQQVEVISEDDAGSNPVDSASPSTAARESSADEGHFLFGTEPLPLELLLGPSLEIELSIKKLLTEIGDLNTVQGSLKLHDGSLHGAIDFHGEQGGTATGKADMQLSSGIDALQLDVMARDLRLNLASGDNVPASAIPPLDLTLSLSSKGASQRALAANSSGRLLLTLGSGQLNNHLVGRFSGDLVTQLFTMLNPFTEKQDKSRFECGLLAYDIRDGSGRMNPIVYQGEKVLIVSSGELDLNDETLALVFRTQPRQGVGVSADMFVTPFVALGGTLARPKISLNTKATLLHGGLAAATGGLSLFAQAAYERLGGERDYCNTVLQKPAYTHPPLR